MPCVERSCSCSASSFPQFPIPLREGDVEPIVDLHTLLDSVYDRGGYDLAIDYSRDPVPSLTEGDRVWVEQFL
ncbi:MULTISPECIES: DUF4058 family protein [Spirulina sp. CCY15215]|uniref:DUF4058 family protein n=1 Tax=Spirulina sp. CCY15215 TaxID=2767591 RepID=UPI0019512291|nr:DUF4058 family protein [Spirulina major]